MKQIKFFKNKWMMIALLLVAAALLITFVPFKDVQAEFSPKLFRALNVKSFSLAKPAGQSIPLRLAAGEFDPLTESKPVSVSERFTIKSFLPGQLGYYLVQFKGPVKTADKKALKQAGARILDYIPDFAFIVKMDETARQKVETLNDVRWVGIYQPGYRIAPSIQQSMLKSSVARIEEFIIIIFPGEDPQVIAFQIQALGGEIVEIAKGLYPKIKTRLTPATLENLAAINGVQWIEPAPKWRLFNDQAAVIMTVGNVWQNYGLFGSGQIVAVADTGLDRGSTTPAQLHDDFEDGAGNTRVLQIIDRAGDGASDVHTGHGTHVAGSVLGNGARSGSTPLAQQYLGSYAGMAPEASLVFQSVENNTTEELSGIPLDLNELFLQAFNANARIHTNSWGSDFAGAYTSDSAAVDQFMWDHKEFLILFSAGNAGTDANRDGVVDLYSIGTPATAKNCISVGASENNRPSGFGRDANYSYWAADYPVNPIYSDHISDNPVGMAAFSSRGPCLDGRFKPDIVAPGTNIASTRSSLATSTMWGLLGLNPAHQPYYTFAGGTSMATPLTAGAATLAREFYTDIKGITPSAALIKATLLNGAFDMNPGQYGSGVTEEISNRPNNVEGWGRVDVENALFPDAPRNFNYYDHAAGLSTGVTHTYNFTVGDNTVPFKATLAWTDYPGTPVADGGLVNDLDLAVLDPNGDSHCPANANHAKSAILAYHDGNPETGITFNAAGIGAAVKFTPSSYPTVINAIRIYYASNNTQTAVVLNIWDDDGAGGMPGTDLSTQTINPPLIPPGYYSEYTIGIPALVINSGSFYIEFRSNQSSDNPYLMMDETAPQGNSYVYDGSTWYVLPIGGINGDWMIEAVVRQSDAAPIDRVNNVEGIDLVLLTTGSYSLYVYGYNVPNGPQPYALIASGGNLSSFNLIYSASNLQASGELPNHINLAWTDNSSNETGFKIERKTGSGVTTYALIHTTGINETTYSDTVLLGTTYFYRIKAANASGDAAPSNEVAIAFSLPDAPSDLTTTSVTSSRVGLHWTDNSTGETGFLVERSLESGATATWTSRGTTSENVVDFTDTCSSATTYYYRVFAYNTLGDSPASNGIEVVTRGGSSATFGGGGGGGGGGGCFIISTSEIFFKPADYELPNPLAFFIFLTGFSFAGSYLAAGKSRHF